MVAPDKCNTEVFEHGESVGFIDVTKEQADEICRQKSEETGDRYDWHYFGGRVHMMMLRVKTARPINMVLYCPNCGKQHIDKPDLCKECPGGDCMCVMQAERWTNPPHRSHLCDDPSCGMIWRPADVPTNGVADIRTAGKNDLWLPYPEEITAAKAQRYDTDKQN